MGSVEGNSTILVGGIIASEVLFWVLLFGGLGARYLLRATRLSTALLLGVPAADLVLVTLTLVDLLRGSVPGNVHGLAAIRSEERRVGKECRARWWCDDGV